MYSHSHVTQEGHSLAPQHGLELTMSAKNSIKRTTIDSTYISQCIMGNTWDKAYICKITLIKNGDLSTAKFYKFTQPGKAFRKNAATMLSTCKFVLKFRCSLSQSETRL